MIYLDSAAVVKLVHAEAESAALRSWLDERAETGWISSVLTEIEAFRALARYAPEAVSRLPAVLDLIDLIPLDPPIRILAQTARPATVRSLDAIHLGTALHARQALTSFVTYDKRLLDAVTRSRAPGRFTRLASGTTRTALPCTETPAGPRSHPAEPWITGCRTSRPPTGRDVIQRIMGPPKPHISPNRSGRPPARR